MAEFVRGQPSQTEAYRSARRIGGAVFVVDRVIENGPDSVLDAESQPESQSRCRRSGNWRESLSFGSIGSIPPLGTTDTSGSSANPPLGGCRYRCRPDLVAAEKAICREMAGWRQLAPPSRRAPKVLWNATLSRAGRVDAGRVVACR